MYGKKQRSLSGNHSIKNRINYKKKMNKYIIINTFDTFPKSKNDLASLYFSQNKIYKK